MVDGEVHVLIVVGSGNFDTESLSRIGLNEEA
jgi:hypothetical protein